MTPLTRITVLLLFVPTLTVVPAWPAQAGGPIFVHEAQLTPSDGLPGDSFGWSVAISGDTAVVGAQLNDTPAGANAGAAYVFVHSGTTWTEQQELLPSDGAADDRFGYSVSVSGDTVVVGTPGDDTPIAGAGSAYVFVRTGTTWSQQQKLVAADAAVDDDFGFAVSVSGDTVVVGARHDDTAAGFDAGSAYVFVRTGTTWTLQQKLLASDGSTDHFFGSSVSLDANTAAIGAPLVLFGTGAAYVFVRTGTAWTQQQKLLASDGAPNDFFGTSLSLSADTVVGGANADDTPAGADAGSAYAFVRTGTTWTEQQKLLASDGAGSDTFGTSVSVSGDTAMIGAPLHDMPASGAGAAYVYVRSGTAWTEQQKLQSPAPPANGLFGFSASLAGDTACIGATGDGPAGSAHVFRAMVPVELEAFTVE